MADCKIHYTHSPQYSFSSSSGPAFDRMRKGIILTFKREGLSITVEANLIEIEFLYITFNINRKVFPIQKLATNHYI